MCTYSKSQFKLISQLPWQGARFTLNTSEPTRKIKKASFSFNLMHDKLLLITVCKEKNKMKYLLAVTDQFVDYFNGRGYIHWMRQEDGHKWCIGFDDAPVTWYCTRSLLAACLQTLSLKWISETAKLCVLRQLTRSDKWYLPDKDPIQMIYGNATSLE